MALNTKKITKKHGKNLIKMKTSNNLKCKIFSYEKFNNPKRVIRNSVLFLATPDKTKQEGKGSQTTKG